MALLALLLSPNCLADWRVSPTVQLRTTYSDNVNLKEDALAREQFIAEVSPGVLVTNNSRRMKFSGSYQRRFFAYSDDEVSNTQRSIQNLSADLKSVLLDELLYLDASGNIAQREVSAFGPSVDDSPYSDLNRAEVRTWRFSPYLRRQFGSAANLIVRYTRDSVDAGESGLRNSTGDAVNLSLASGELFRRFGWNLSLNRQVLDFERAPESTIENGNLGFSYALGSSLTLTSGIGYDRYDYQALGGRTAGRTWNAGFQWAPSQRSFLSANVGKRFTGSTYMLKALHRSRNTVWNISYDDAITTTRSQFLLPATVDTAGLLDRLFMANFPDPAERAQAVQAYIQATGLPPSLADNVNYFSNRFILQKQAQASVAFNSARTTTVLNIADTRREALSTVQTDSPLQGTGSLNLNDNVHQKSAGVLWNMRITKRSGLNLSLTANKSRSITTGQTNDTRALRSSLTREFSPRTRGGLELRHIEGRRTNGSDYSENAISASLSFKL